ncbi:MAG: 3'-5' exonuclease [Cytophagales bacterium]|nr:3'-5' exonuclease [Cytophagales bacterium]
MSPQKYPALTNILFLDIETVSAQARFEELSPSLQKHWKHKVSLMHREEGRAADELYFERAGMYSEFGKVVCIGVGYFLEGGQDELTLRVKALRNDNELQLLLDFKSLVEERFNPDQLRLCAHNGKEFDFPYLCRRMMINQTTLPQVLDLRNKKPWEVEHYDTLEMWKFGDRKHYTSLDLLAAVFGLQSSKGDMDGSQVNTVYHHQHDLDRIADYCLDDVVVLARLFLKYKLLPDLSDDRVIRL